MRPGNTKQLSVSIPKETMSWLREEAKREQRTVSNMVAVILERERRRQGESSATE